jgi:hypothetical protein
MSTTSWSRAIGRRPIFRTFKKHSKNRNMAGLRLNPNKCIFGIKKGKLLGCLVSARGIEENPEKIVAIVNMKPLASKKQVQKLTGRLAAMNRFISRSAEKGLPFFRTLQSSGHFKWGHE